MKSKKLLKTLLVAMLAICMLAMTACGKSKETETTKTETTKTETTEAETTKTETTEAETTEAETTEAETTEAETTEAETAEVETCTLAVTGPDGAEKEYTLELEGDSLYDCMVAGGINFDGYQSDWGYYLTTIDDILADYETDGAYWSLYVNGEYGQYSLDAQPVAAGDIFELKYEVYSGM